MTLPANIEAAPLSQVASFLISILFWTTLTCAAGLYAVLALSPRLSESLTLRNHYNKNAASVSKLDQEITHLSKVAQALKHDPEFVARVAGRELASMSPSDHLQIQVDQHLNYDARTPVIEVQQTPEAPWYANSVHQLSQPTPLRKQTLLATLILFSVAFVCFNDGFFSNRFGTTLILICRKVVTRYQSDAPFSH